ncbi:hypothetical protein [Streptomyces sp. NBC_00996]|uniref:hypothetical protein n=1 Tax=Streptomyces sp. NBC_00996 TaxID=2903710 RepID=UPI00386A5EB5|nr:hypothetical protein OG390_15865 [Streptomyces sp. NBC_00996]
MKRRLAQFGVIFLGIEAWVALRDTTSVVSLVIGCVCIAILACCFALRVWREIQTIKDDNKQARDRQEARRREQQW